ncbi:uncharacterized protein LOC131876950 [Tigriopus californicus]|uniref:uncharacterized protein LOC131876950 n=1 Tax=Tigriopus californicus TaxID=6832 RepID=UPI0027DA8459|nr:uncharacterized protein LOC131876950 [Tigriopus californicus]
MSNREAIQTLKASRSGFKSALTRARNMVKVSLDEYVDGEDHSLSENLLRHWDDHLQKFLAADDQVMCGLASDMKDADPAVDDHVQAFLKPQVLITGYRREVEAVNRQTMVNSNVAAPIPDGRHPVLPRLDAKKPPLLEEDTTHKTFVRWRPLRNNYSQLTYLEHWERAIQVGFLWECCSPGFLRIIQHSLGIRADTGRTVFEILDIIEDHLRSLRNVHMDMRDLLSVTQREGQDYTSFCNTIRGLADYANTSKISEDRLLIALLFQGMRHNSDKAKVMERNPATLDEARRYILELETARSGARAFGTPLLTKSVNAVDHNVNAAKSSYKRNGD